MSEEKPDQFSTPYRGTEDKDVSETALKAGEESNIQEDNGDEPEVCPGQDDLELKLNSLQNDIKDTQERLRLVKQNKQKAQPDTEQYHNLEDERRVLRKNLIDLDYQHKLVFEQYKKRNQEIEKQKSQERIKQLEEEYQRVQDQREQESLERSRKLQAQLEDIQKEQERRRDQIRNLSQKRNQKKEVLQEAKEEEPAQAESEIKPTDQGIDETPAEEAVGEGEKAPEDATDPAPPAELTEEEARHQARVAEIELELASQRLRRSRQVELESELIRIRTDYPAYPWWRSYPYSYRLFLGPYDYPSLYSYPRYPSLLDYPRYPSALDYPRYPSPLDYPLYSYRRFYPFI